MLGHTRSSTMYPYPLVLPSQFKKNKLYMLGPTRSSTMYPYPLVLPSQKKLKKIIYVRTQKIFNNVSLSSCYSFTNFKKKEKKMV
jgi:hypothetical protein